MLLYIGHTGNFWSTSEIPLNQYQEKLLERHRRETEQMKLILQERTRELQEKRETEQLRCALQEKERELQEERRELEQVTG